MWIAMNCKFLDETRTPCIFVKTTNRNASLETVQAGTMFNDVLICFSVCQFFIFWKGTFAMQSHTRWPTSMPAHREHTRSSLRGQPMEAVANIASTWVCKRYFWGSLQTTIPPGLGTMCRDAQNANLLTARCSPDLFCACERYCCSMLLCKTCVWYLCQHMCGCKSQDFGSLGKPA